MERVQMRVYDSVGLKQPAWVNKVEGAWCAVFFERGAAAAAVAHSPALLAEPNIKCSPGTYNRRWGRRRTVGGGLQGVE
jgi:hypothetical protein